jgi:enterobactin synthetase component D
MDTSAHAMGIVPSWVSCVSTILGEVGDARMKREREFAAGRWCARRALAAMGAQATEVGVGASGEPVWPAGATGSIAHTDRLAIAVAATRQRARAIGIDVEPVMSAARMRAVAEQIAAPGEIEAVVRDAGCSAAVAATLVFSAKEALYKCLFSDVGRVFDYLDAVLDEVNLARGTMRLRLTTTLAERWPEGAAVVGTVALVDGLVYTAVVLRTSDECPA